LNEQYSTGQSDPNGRHQWNGKVGDRRQNWNSPRLATNPQASAQQDHHDGKHPNHDTAFLAWREQHFPRLAKRDAMLLHIRDLNGQNKIRHEQEMEQWKSYMRSRLLPEQRKELEDLKARNVELDVRISEHKALYEAKTQAIVLSPPNNSQNISSPPEQSSPQIHSAPPPLEQPPSLNIPQPNGEQMTDPPEAHRAASTEIVDANKLTMQQALEEVTALSASGKEI
jgi:hypothetical protein